jgi:DNA repair exonuclease SbcCD ATPase subunit
MNRIVQILMVLGFVTMACLITAHYAESSAAGKVAAAIAARDAALKQVEEVGKERDDLKAQAKVDQDRAAEWQQKANEAMNRVATLEPSLKAAQAKMAALKPQPGQTDVTTLPTDEGNLAADYKQAGFPPLIQDGSLGFTISVAQPMLGVVLDGLQYPLALQRIQALGEEVTIQAAQKVQLQAAVEDKTQEAAAQAQATQKMTAAEQDCEKQVTLLQGAVQDDKVAIKGLGTELKAEKVKKWTWGGVGVAVGWLLKVVLLHGL